MAPRVPETIGDYKVLEEIGHGGMGTLYRARDPKIGRDVAVKLLREGLDDNDMRERFAREARSAGRLKHGNIVTIFELGEHNGMPFIAMEYVQGETLASFLRRRPPVALTRKLQIMDQICAGLHYAHRMGIVHRDIKPANIMIDDEGTLKILDFGIARMGASKITQTGMVIGTLNYMAPEQMKGMATDQRADMFSIGAVFYELLSYRNAFAGDAPSTVMHKILYGRPEQLEIVCPNLDPALVSIVTRCLEKLPENRYPDLGAVRSALGSVVRRLQLAAEQAGSTENDQTVPIVIATPDPRKEQKPASSGSRKDSQSAEQMRVRAEQTRAKQLQAHLDVGRRALEQADYDGAFAACEQALVLDPTNPQALDLEARARAALDRQLEEHLSAARAEIDRGALTAAAMLADQVLAIKADSVEANQIRHDIEGARHRLAEEQERERERQRAFDQAYAEAQQQLTAGALDAADQAIERALALDTAHREALALKGKITAAATAAREARRRAEEEIRARKAVDEAKRVFGTGDHAAAFAMLEAVLPNAAAAATLDALRLEKKEMDRRRAEAEQKRLEAQAEQTRLEAEAARLAQETAAARKKLEAEVERLKREGEAERRKLEAETERLKREAEAQRLQREAETARRRRELEAGRLKQAEVIDPSLEGDPSTIQLTGTTATLPGRSQTAADGPRIYQPPPPKASSVPSTRDAGRRGPSNAVLFGGLAAVLAFLLLAVFVGRPGRSADTVSPPAQPPAVGETPAAPPPPPPQPTAADQIRQRLAQAGALLDAGNYDAAILEVDQALALESGNADALQLRARATAMRSAAQAQPPPAAGRGSLPPPTPSPAPLPPSRGGVILTGESRGSAPPAAPPQPPAGQSARDRDLADRYGRARGAVDSGAFAAAIPLLEQLQRDEPNYRDVPAQLARAREGQSASAKQALDSGAKLEASGDLPAAVQQFERARQLDSGVAATADPAIARLRARMAKEGADAYTRARQYDALDLAEQAMPQYERAVRLLPDNDPNRKIASERLAFLRSRK
jgi:tRNA A-37 threonylcarbamoyl transferase component Bud32